MESGPGHRVDPDCRYLIQIVENVVAVQRCREPESSGQCLSAYCSFVALRVAVQVGPATSQPVGWVGNDDASIHDDS